MEGPPVPSLKTVLLEVRALSGEARAAYLDRLGAEDPSLRDEVVSLLAFEDQGPSLLREGGILRKFEAFHTTDAGTPGRGDPSASARAAVGEEIGAYTLVDVLGEGGMGVVYRAEQRSPIQREVALKLIRRGFDTDRIVARFTSERQALARMDHPSIARVLEAGATPDGRPYFVMELVQGLPITEFCDRERLALRDRITLLLRVCEGIQHAHQKGIIHRDLKPSNVLVARRDGAARPKVIDFGIAKAIENPIDDQSLLTREGQFIGTPDYMSPEQAGAIEAGVDTRTDVYALGVLLYELLSGRRPHQFTRRTQDEVQQVLKHQQPERPSTRVTGRRRITRAGTPIDPAAVARIAENRRTSSERLRRQLTGDLDNIILKAMQKDPERRYGSVEQLADDLQRYLDGRPVFARPDSWSYRTTKFVRRHKVGVGLAATAAILLVAFVVMMAVQSARIARERDRALAAEQRARTEAATATRVSDFLTGLFEISDPQNARGKEISAREMLDRGADRILTELKDTPDVQARLLYTMGDVYKQLGRYDEAIRLYEASRVIRENGPAEPLSDTLDTLGDTERYRGRPKEGLALLTRALQIRKSELGLEHVKVAQTLNNLGIAYNELGRYDDAEASHREALRIRRARLGENEERVANSLSNLGIVLMARSRYDQAEEVFRSALAIRRKVHPSDHPRVAASLNGLARVLNYKGKYSESESNFREALAIRRKVLEPTHPDVAATVNDLASLLHDRGRFDEAEALYLESMSVARQVATPGVASMEVARVVNNLASLYEDRGEYRRAEPLFLESLALRKAARGERHMTVATAENNLGKLYLQMGRLAESEQRLRHSLALGIELGREPQVTTAITRINLGRALEKRQRYASAGEQYGLAVDALTQLLPADHPTLLVALLSRGRLLTLQRRPADAEPLLRRVADARGRALPASHWQLAEARVAHAHALADLGRDAEAAPLVDAALRALTTVTGPRQTAVRDDAVRLAHRLKLPTRTPPASPPATPAAASESDRVP